MINIFGGKYRGKKLEVPDEVTVPTKNRVREAVFDIYGPSIMEAKVLDLFAGSGAIALEAYSRGASYVAINEKDKGAFGTIKRNARGFDVELLNLDYEKAILELSKKGKVFDLVYIDPPYKEKGFYAKAVSLILQNGLVHQGSKLMLEYEEEPPMVEGDFSFSKTYRYGRTYILVLVI